MSRFLSSAYRDMEAYVPGEQPRDRRYVKLNTNESPFPPSPAVVAAYDAEKGNVNLYSDPTAKALTEAAAEVYGRESRRLGGGDITPDMVIAGNGSDEILAFCVLAFFRDGGAAFPRIGYGFYPVFCNLFGVPFDEIPMKGEYEVDLHALAASSRNVMIANPNAQTGVYLPISDIEAIVSANKNRIVLVDEAYCDFGGESAVSLLERYDNLIVVTTLSKSRQLAGGRIGLAFSSREIVCDLNKIRYSFNPYNLDRAAIAAGAAALLDGEYFDRTRNAVAAERERLKERLSSLGFAVSPSLANFVLARREGISGEELYKQLKARGVLVRYLGGDLSDYVRITVGSADECDVLIEAVKEIIKEKNI